MVLPGGSLAPSAVENGENFKRFGENCTERMPGLRGVVQEGELICPSNDQPSSDYRVPQGSVTAPLFFIFSQM